MTDESGYSMIPLETSKHFAKKGDLHIFDFSDLKEGEYKVIEMNPDTGEYEEFPDEE